MDNNAIPESPLREEPRKRLVRNYLLDANLQLRYASYLVAVATAISIALGWMLWSAYRETSRVIALGDPLAASGLSSTLARVDRTRMLWLIAGLIVVVICLLVFAVIVTHRVAGPAHFLTQVCRRVAEGDYSRPRPLRQRDLLTELADEITVMIDMLRQRDERERSLILAAVELIRRGGQAASDLATAVESLEKLAGEKTRRLS